MPHDVPLITTLAAAFGFALVLGFVAVRLHLPALVGYLVAGVLIGPAAFTAAHGFIGSYSHTFLMVPAVSALALVLLVLAGRVAARGR